MSNQIIKGSLVKIISNLDLRGEFGIVVSVSGRKQGYAHNTKYINQYWVTGSFGTLVLYSPDIAKLN